MAFPKGKIYFPDFQRNRAVFCGSTLPLWRKSGKQMAAVPDRHDSQHQTLNLFLRLIWMNDEKRYKYTWYAESIHHR